MRTECVARVENPDGCGRWTDRQSLVCPASVSEKLALFLSSSLRIWCEEEFELLAPLSHGRRLL
jgi:hypothetical protein